MKVYFRSIYQPNTTLKYDTSRLIPYSLVSTLKLTGVVSSLCIHFVVLAHSPIYLLIKEKVNAKNEKIIFTHHYFIKYRLKKQWSQKPIDSFLRAFSLSVVI